jgi:hypothetical protein
MRRAAARPYDRLASILAKVQRFSVARGPKRRRSILLLGKKRGVYKRTLAAIRARFNSGDI